MVLVGIGKRVPAEEMVLYQFAGIDVAQGLARDPILARRPHVQCLHQDVVGAGRLDLVVVARRLSQAGSVAVVGDLPQLPPRVVGVQGIEFLIDGTGRGAATVARSVVVSR